MYFTFLSDSTIVFSKSCNLLINNLFFWSSISPQLSTKVCISSCNLSIIVFDLLSIKNLITSIFIQIYGIKE
jgi:hypothetical protein